MNKYAWAYEVLTSPAVHPDSLVIFTDCTDTYLMCSADELEHKFEAFGAEIVSAAEVHMWPHDRMKKLIRMRRAPNPYPETPTPLRYGNTGQYAGRGRDLVRFFDRMRSEWETGKPWTWCCPTGLRYVMPAYSGPEITETDCFNDQRCIHTYIAAGFHKDRAGPRVVFDALADLFLSANKMLTRITITGSRIHFNLSQALAPKRGPKQLWKAGREASLPCWIHTPGSSKPYFSTFTRSLMMHATGKTEVSVVVADSHHDIDNLESRLLVSEESEHR